MTLYQEELFCKVERELRTAFVRQNRNKKGILKKYSASCVLTDKCFPPSSLMDPSGCLRHFPFSYS